MSSPPEGIQPLSPESSRDGCDGTIRDVVITRVTFTPYLLLALPFWATLALIAGVGMYLGVADRSASTIVVALAAAAAVIAIAWPIASTMFGRERVKRTTGGEGAGETVVAGGAQRVWPPWPPSRLPPVPWPPWASDLPVRTRSRVW